MKTDIVEKPSRMAGWKVSCQSCGVSVMATPTPPPSSLLLFHVLDLGLYINDLWIEYKLIKEVIKKKRRKKKEMHMYEKNNK